MSILKGIASDLFFHRDCVQCRAFDKGEKKETCSQECMHFNMTLVESRDKLPQPGQPDPLSHCKEKDVDDCWFYFTYSVNSNGEANVHVVETPGMNTVFPALPSSLLLIHAVVCYKVTLVDLCEVGAFGNGYVFPERELWML